MKSADAYLYESVAQTFMQLIDSGELAPGEKLPSLRQLATTRNISVSTALEAYSLLETRGYVETRPQSGYYIRKQRSFLAAPPRATRDLYLSESPGIDERVAQMLNVIRDPQILQLGAATPPERDLPLRALNRCLMRAINSEHAHAYETPQGSPGLRHEIALRASIAGASAQADDVIVTAGCMEGLALTLGALAEPGDLIAVETPVYFGFLQLARALRLKTLEIPSDAVSGMSLNFLESALKRYPVRAVLTIPNFHNPTGALMPAENRRALIELTGRYNTPIIEDDIYGDLHYDSRRPGLLRSLDDSGRIYTVSSFSKTVSPGMRLGWIIAGKLKTEILARKRRTSVFTSTISQIAAESFLRGGVDRSLRKLRRAVQQSTFAVADLALECFPEGARLVRPAGGFLLWVELPEGVETLELQTRALQRGVSVAPGPLFSASGGFRNFLRLNAAQGAQGRAGDAVRILGRLAHEMLEKRGG